MPLSEETAVRVQVEGTTVMAVYEVQDGVLMLTSADFGEAQAPLDGRLPEDVATELLRTLTGTAMARDGETFLCDDKSIRPSA